MKYETYIDEELHQHALKEEFEDWSQDKQDLFNNLFNIILQDIMMKLRRNDDLIERFFSWCFGDKNDDMYLEELIVEWNKLHGEQYWIKEMKFFLVDFRVMFVMWAKSITNNVD